MRIYLQNLAVLQFSRYSKSNTTWSFAYDANGMRTQRTNGSTTYTYTYDDSTLVRMTVGNNTLIFTYGASGHPMAVEYNGTSYYYVTNALGDVLAIINESGTEVVTYNYDAWGNNISTAGTMAGTLGAHNPLRYRSYVYDQEIGLYYLQSRYYNPHLCRFINADAYVSTGQGILGYNMFAYCNNNPVNCIDNSGTAAISVCNGDRNPLFIGYIGLGGGGGAGGMLFCAGIAIYTAITEAVPFKPAQKAEEKAEDIATTKQPDNPVIFPVNPNDFNPLGLDKVYRPGTKNGAFISWVIPLTNIEVFRWDENPNYPNGPHYHINDPIYRKAKVHFYPGAVVPEPYATIYFPFG